MRKLFFILFCSLLVVPCSARIITVGGNGPADFGKDGGYIMAASDHFFETPVENLKAFAEAAKECTY